jgi:hypothetical protein
LQIDWSRWLKDAPGKTSIAFQSCPGERQPGSRQFILSVVIPFEAEFRI